MVLHFYVKTHIPIYLIKTSGRLLIKQLPLNQILHRSVVPDIQRYYITQKRQQSVEGQKEIALCAKDDSHNYF